MFMLAAIALAACSQSDDEKAQPLMAKIESLYSNGQYQQTLDSITSLRERFPKAIKSREHALKIWQNASLKMAQKGVADADLQLQEVNRQLQGATSLLQKNRLMVKRDSLKARYEAMCGVVRMIHMRQKQQ